MAQPEQPTNVIEIRAARLLKTRSVWIFPLAVASVLVMLMTLLYFGSIVDPSEHLHGLPVAVVDEDAGANTASGRVDLGGQVTQALTHTRAITDRLAVTAASLSQAEATMNKGGAYVTVVIPADFTASLLSLAHGSGAPATPEPPTIELLANSRAGTLGVSLGEAVLEPALADSSRDIGARLAPEAAPDSLARVLLANPVTVSVAQYRSLPSHAGLGLSAFYVSLLIMMCGFLGATIINSALDSALGYASTEVGPRWSQRLPKRISRWQTLLAKWAVAVPGTLLFTGLMLGVAAGCLRMDAPDWFELWMFGWFAAAVVAIGTLVLFAALGAPGQLIALLVFVYLALASSGGTVPLQALAGFYRFVANFEPLRQIVGGVRAILYFNGMGVAGLDRGLLLTAIGLVFWLVSGVLVTNWYDRKGFHRIHPDLLDYAYKSVREYHELDLPAGGAAGHDQVDLTGR
jgi:YhgE/Pip-like protein